MANTPPTSGTDRRAIPQRSTTWAARLADGMAAAKLTPNMISVLSVVVAFIGAVALFLPATALFPEDYVARNFMLVVTAVCIPLRLLLNMLDGMLAVEKEMKTPTGDIFNELPDRLADAALLVAAGYATLGAFSTRPRMFSGPTDMPMPENQYEPVSNGLIDLGLMLGIGAAIMAVLTAYVRTLGAANGVGNFFAGPTAKPARMWILEIGIIISLFEPLFGSNWVPGSILVFTVFIIFVGSTLTVIRRLRLISKALHAQSAAGTSVQPEADAHTDVDKESPSL